MKNVLLLLSILSAPLFSMAQNGQPRKDIFSLIDKYSEAREKRDTTMLKTILTADIDQLVSTGEWRNGISESVKGMLQSSAASPGTRKLVIDKIRMLDQRTALVD